MFSLRHSAVPIYVVEKSNVLFPVSRSDRHFNANLNFNAQNRGQVGAILLRIYRLNRPRGLTMYAPAATCRSHTVTRM